MLTCCRKSFLPAVIVVAVTGQLASGQSIIRVDGANGAVSPSGGGNGWGTNAFKYLQDAISAAQQG